MPACARVCVLVFICLLDCLFVFVYACMCVCVRALRGMCLPACLIGPAGASFRNKKVSKTNPGETCQGIFSFFGKNKSQKNNMCVVRMRTHMCARARACVCLLACLLA